MAGVSREHVNRTLNDWKRRQLVNQLDGYYCTRTKRNYSKRRSFSTAYFSQARLTATR